MDFGIYTCTIQVERYVNDPLNWHGALKARWGVAMVKSITLLRENVGRISLPLLIIHGSDDNLVPITSSYFLNDNVSSQKKKFEVRKSITFTVGRNDYHCRCLKVVVTRHYMTGNRKGQEI